MDVTSCYHYKLLCVKVIYINLTYTKLLDICYDATVCIIIFEFTSYNTMYMGARRGGGGGGQA